MNNSLPQMSLKDGLDIWSKNKDVSEVKNEEHLSAVELLRFTGPGGMEAAPAERKEHLSCCSLCMEKWLAICEEKSLVDELTEEKSSDDWYSGGMMEAAAADVSSAIVLKSRCGNFQLSLYPDSRKNGEGMVTLEFIGSSDREIEGKWVTVKDMNGLLLLDGSLRAGRVATICKNFKEMDLQAWSIQIQTGQKDGGAE